MTSHLERAKSLAPLLPSQLPGLVDACRVKEFCWPDIVQLHQSHLDVGGCPRSGVNNGGLLPCDAVDEGGFT